MFDHFFDKKAIMQCIRHSLKIDKRGKTITNTQTDLGVSMDRHNIYITKT